jgi:carbon-monoxide dehydrogenase medium subunit
VQLDADDRVQRSAIALIGMGSTPERASAAEAAVMGRAVDEVSPDDVGALAVRDLTSIPDDLHGSAAYRTRVGAAVVARAWTAATEEARASDA